MPYWPIPVVLTAIILLFGLRYGAWLAPLIVLAGYAAMRGVIAQVPVELHEIAGCTLWLLVGAVLCYKGAWVPGFFYTLSGMTYPALLVFGFKIEYMGLSPIIAAIFGLCALLGMGLGILALSPLADNYRSLDRWADLTLGVATRSVRD